MSNLILGCSTFLLCLLLILMLARIAPYIGLVDTPDHRKQHTGDIPLVGGLALYISLAIVIPFADTEFGHLLFSAKMLDSLLLAGGVLVAVGMLDDIFDLRVSIRIAGEVAAALVVLQGLGIDKLQLGDLVGTGNIVLEGFWMQAFTSIAVFGVINAFNMLDGIDGLLALLVLIAISAIYILTAWQIGPLLSSVAGALLAFLVSNLGLVRKIPKTFMGDAGSMLLGLIVVTMTLAASSSRLGGDKHMEAATALFVVALPLFDMVFVSVRRVSKGHSPFYADRTHIHHLLERVGLSRKESLLAITVLASVPPLFGYLLDQARAAASAQFMIFLLMFVSYCLMAWIAWRLVERRTARQ